MTHPNKIKRGDGWNRLMEAIRQYLDQEHNRPFVILVDWLLEKGETPYSIAKRLGDRTNKSLYILLKRFPKSDTTSTSNDVEGGEK